MRTAEHNFFRVFIRAFHMCGKVDFFEAEKVVFDLFCQSLQRYDVGERNAFYETFRRFRRSEGDRAFSADESPFQGRKNTEYRRVGKEPPCFLKRIRTECAACHDDDICPRRQQPLRPRYGECNEFAAAFTPVRRIFIVSEINRVLKITVFQEFVKDAQSPRSAVEKARGDFLIRCHITKYMPPPRRKCLFRYASGFFGEN